MENKIKQFRLARSLKAIAFAKLIGISRQALYAIEHCKSKPSIKTLTSIANAFNCRIEDLI